MVPREALVPRADLHVLLQRGTGLHIELCIILDLVFDTLTFSH